MVIERDATVTDDGSTTTRGNCKVTVTENDLLNLPTQFLSYNVHLVDSNNEKTLLTLIHILVMTECYI